MTPNITDITEQSIGIGPFPPATFAVGAIAELAGKVRGLGATRAAIVTDRGLVATPLPGSVAALLAEAGLAVEVFGDVHPNPTTDDVDSGAAVVRALGAETAVVSLGGGSALDGAKAIALAAANSVPAAALDWGNPALAPALPIVAVPTTSGTGAECNDFGVVTDTATHRKCYLGGPSCLARAVILDPALTLTLPAGATAASGIDCLTHAVESFLSIRANAWADGLDLQVVRLVAQFLRRAVTDGSDLEARSHLLLAAHTAGLAMSTTGLGIVHGVAHPLGGRFDVPHGVALAMVLGECLRFNRPQRVERLARLAEPLGVFDASASQDRNADAAIAAIEQLVADVRLNLRLDGFGITKADLPQLVADTLADAVMANTPRTASAEDVQAILLAAL
jgi:alcohol dehydrogenase class IV